MQLKRLIVLVVTTTALAGCNATPSTPLLSPTATSLPAASATVSPSTEPAATAEPALPFKRTACAPGTDLTGLTVNFDHLIDQNSQIDEFVAPMKAGLEDAAAYFNAHGGICGAAVAQVYPPQPGAYRTGIDYARFTAQSPKPVLIGLYGSGDAEQLREQLAHDQIPALGIRVGSVLGLYGDDGQTPGWIFSTSPTYADQFGAFCQYLAQHPQQYPEPIVGYLSWAPNILPSAFTPETLAYCRALGIRVLGTPIYFAEEAVDIHSLVQQLVDAGANILYSNSLGTGAALVARTLVEMKLKPAVALATGNWGLDTSIGPLAQMPLGADGLPAMNGIIGSLPLPSWSETDQPGVRLVADQADLHQRPLSQRNNFYMLGWTSTDLFIELYIQTGNRVGFDHVTGVEVKKTLTNIVYSPLGGPLTIDYQGGLRRSLTVDRMGQLDFLGRDGKNPAGPNNPLLLVSEASQELPVPMRLPLSAFQPAPDLRPGGADVPNVPEPTSTPVPPGTATPGAPSAAMGRIAYQGGRSNQTDFIDIFVMRADGTSQTRLTNNQVADLYPVFSPDGARIAFMSRRDGNDEVYVMNADGSGQVRLTNNPANDSPLDWSPDGQRILFRSDRDGNVDIYSMNADGSGVTRLTDSPADDSAASFAPDGQTIAFVSNRDGHSNIYIMQADGTGVAQLTHFSAGDITDTRWSPDGKHIAFVSTQDGNQEIYVINADGSGQTRLTHSPTTDEGPAWSPDSQQIVFDSDRSGNFQLYVMNADGSAQTQLTNDPDGAAWPTWAR